MVQVERKDADRVSTSRGWSAFAEHVGRVKIFPKNQFTKLHHLETVLGAVTGAEASYFLCLVIKMMVEEWGGEGGEGGEGEGGGGEGRKKRSQLVQNKVLEKEDSRHESPAHPG